MGDIGTKLDSEVAKVTPVVQPFTKKIVSKITLIVASGPPLIYSFLVYFLKLNQFYFLAFLCLYFTCLYWLVETRFDSLYMLSGKIQNILSQYV